MPTRPERQRTPSFITPDLIGWLHDAGNLIRNIDVCIHLLAAPDLDEQTRRRVHQSAVRTIAVLKDMFPSLRRPAQRRRRPTVCELYEATDCCVDLLRQQARTAGVTIEIVAESDLLFTRGDRGIYQRVIYNLMLNAIEASRRGGRVTVKLRREDGNIALAIDDTGSGMSRSVRRRVFKGPFTTKPKGSGRGLLSSAATVATLGGAMAVSSRLGRGTTIMLRFPAAPIPKGTNRVRARRD